jgi:cyanophycinase
VDWIPFPGEPGQNAPPTPLPVAGPVRYPEGDPFNGASRAPNLTMVKSSRSSGPFRLSLIRFGLIRFGPVVAGLVLLGGALGAQAAHQGPVEAAHPALVEAPVEAAVEAAAEAADPFAVPCPPLPPGAAEAYLGGEAPARIEARTPSPSNPSPAVPGDSRGPRTLVLMGGSTEVDEASRRFVRGHVLVLRASGSVTSYNPYFARMAPEDAPLHSTGSVLIEDPAVSADPALLCRVAASDALWLAGGNQWNYLGRWAPALQDAIAEVGVRGALGGTSAGAAVLGAFAFDAGEGGLTSTQALAEPLAPNVRVVPSRIGQPELAATLVDQHFRERDREGRLLVFLAHMQRALDGAPVYGIGLDERAALVIEEGRFQVLAHEGRGVSFYRLLAPAPLEPGRPFALEGVERIVLANGASGPWPLDFDAHPRDVLAVEDGLVRLRTQLPEGEPLR